MKKSQSVANQPAGGVLEPISLGAFFEDYWEQKPLHIARPNANPFAELVSINSIEALISTNALKYPTVQLSHAGQSIPISNYTDDDQAIVPNRVIEHYREGGTIVISHAHRLVTNLMSLCRTIQSSLMMQCQTNVYLSPAGNQGFNPHYDTHDVFILQVSGKKTFNFYSSGASFPTSADRFNSEIHDIGEKTEEIVLGAGDTLYIPRGVVHDAVADSDTPSLHVTLGVYPILLHSLVTEVVDIAFDSDSRLRRAITQSAWMRDENAESTTSLIKEVLLEHLQEDVVQAAMERLRDDIALGTIQDSRGSLAGGKSVELQPDSNLVINQDKILRVERSAHALKLCTFGQIVEFSEPLGTAVEWLLERQATKLSDIPALDQSQQHALAEQLLALEIISV